MSTMVSQNPDVHFSSHDQENINNFARYNAKLEEIREELNISKNYLKSLAEAEEELLLLNEDSCGKVPVLTGEIFILETLETTQQRLAAERAKVADAVETLVRQQSGVRANMGLLKGQLQGKFGPHVHLHVDENDGE